MVEATAICSIADSQENEPNPKHRRKPLAISQRCPVRAGGPWSSAGSEGSWQPHSPLAPGFNPGSSAIQRLPCRHTPSMPPRMVPGRTGEAGIGQLEEPVSPTQATPISPYLRPPSHPPGRCAGRAAAIDYVSMKGRRDDDDDEAATRDGKESRCLAVRVRRQCGGKRQSLGATIDLCPASFSAVLTVTRYQMV